MGHPDLWWGGRKAVVLRTMPNHAMRLHEWGTPSCGLPGGFVPQLKPMSQKRDMGHPDLWWGGICDCVKFGSCFFSQDGGGVHLQRGADRRGGAGYGYDEGGGDYYGE